MVEIALGPMGVFENGNIGNLRRVVPLDQLLRTVPSTRGNLKTPRVPIGSLFDVRNAPRIFVPQIP